MRKYLLPENGNFYKANLHCHTNVSDGLMSPEEVKEAYKSRGYSVVAYTDHCIMVPHHDLSDEDFIALTGYETEQNEVDLAVPGSRRRSHHTCFIALKKDNITMPYYAPKSFWHKNKVMVDQISINRDHVIEGWGRDPELTNQLMALAREQEFFVTYNHPSWSVDHAEDYCRYNGMHAMEIMNYASWREGYGDYNPHVYDELLRSGQRIFCIAADDNHDLNSSFGGWTMIKADKLEYETITDALVKGNFYASFGPEIKALWYEDGKVVIETSPAKRIVCTFPNRRALGYIAEAGEELLTRAEFPILPDDGYFRITVSDEQRCCADTNAYFVDTLLEK